jgi:hypothetical protein
VSLFLNWACGQCGKHIEMKVLGEEIKRANGGVYDLPLPPGWLWRKYNSIRFPDRDSRALGCCEEHARLAAMKFEIPEWAEEKA